MKILYVVLSIVIIILQPLCLFGQENKSFPNNNIPNSNFQSNNFPKIDNLLSDFDKAFSEEELTSENEYYIGRAVAAEILTEYRLYNADNELTCYLNLICQALVINSNYQNVYNGYHVMILDSSVPNAFSTPGGHIFITKGLIEITTSEDALAGIIAHELAHVMIRHGMKMINDMRNVLEMDDMAGQAAIFSGKESARADSFRSVVHGYFDTMIKSGYSQPQEFEADTQALKLLAEAGYSPGKLTEVLRTLQSIQKEYSGSIFSTHPALNERITNVERQIIIYKMTDNSDMRKERFYRIMRHDTRQ